MKADNHEATQTVQVLPDPRLPVPMEDRQKKLETIRHVTQRIEVAAEAVDRIIRMRRVIDVVSEQARERNDDTVRELRRAADDLRKKLTAVADRFLDEPNRIQGIMRSPNTVSARLISVLSALNSSWDAPNRTELTYLRQAEGILEAALKEFNAVFNTDVPAFRQKVEAVKLSLFPEYEPLNMEWKRRE